MAGTDSKANELRALSALAFDELRRFPASIRDTHLGIAERAFRGVGPAAVRFVESQQVDREIALPEPMRNLIEQLRVVRLMTAGRVLLFPIQSKQSLHTAGLRRKASAVPISHGRSTSIDSAIGRPARW